MKKLEETMRDLALNKQLNFLIGSGCSMPAVPLMGLIDVPDNEDENEHLKKKISDISRTLLNNEYEDRRDNNIYSTLLQYKNFIEVVVNLLNASNSRTTPKSVNIFTTNYDLFIEKAIDEVLKSQQFIFNDGASGYFDRSLESANYNRTVSYRGLNDNYTNELPSVSLVKPHGSVNWEESGERIFVRKEVVTNPFVVPPTGHESQDTFMGNHFYEMLRVFQLELDKPQSVLFIIGFSFQDKHIGKMIKRAMRNPELLIYAFAHTNSNEETFKDNLRLIEDFSNFRIITPEDMMEPYKIREKNGDSYKDVITLEQLTAILKI